MSDTVLSFYEQLAHDYHLIYADWSKSIERQGAALDRLIRAYCPDCPPLDVLDCSCGIGTQAIGLAARGYRVHATDLSPAAVTRAADEAAARRVPLTVGVADFRALEDAVTATFDLVLSCDNALPHLVSDADLRRAARSMYGRLRPGGMLLVSIRDYDQLVLEKRNATLPQVFDDSAGRRIVFQVWDWATDSSTYTLTMFILRQQGGGWATLSYATTYRALLRAELSAILSDAGFADIRWHMPQDTGYYQPVVVARRAP